jgi:ribA/ribD-fused uncharacterized protein
LVVREWIHFIYPTDANISFAAFLFASESPFSEMFFNRFRDAIIFSMFLVGEDPLAVYFYSVRDEYGCFSNFSPHGFELDGKHWPTSEHYFQAMKFKGSSVEERIRAAPSPKDAANLGRERSFPLREDWESVKDDIMREAVWAKFSTHGDIRQILLGTGDEEIVEKALHDSYWGCGPDGNGRNMLGKILMEARARFRSSTKA